MQRQPYAPPPAHSPPLHHPVPQHVSTVPMMRSPPPPASSQGGTPYGGYVNPAGNAGSQFAPAFGGFMNDQTAQMGFQLGKSAALAGQDYVEQNVGAHGCLQAATHADLSVAQSLCLDISFEALLQCHNLLCPPQAATRSLSLAAQALVTTAATFDNG